MCLRVRRDLSVLGIVHMRAILSRPPVPHNSLVRSNTRVLDHDT